MLFTEEQINAMTDKELHDVLTSGVLLENLPTKEQLESLSEEELKETWRSAALASHMLKQWMNGDVSRDLLGLRLNCGLELRRRSRLDPDILNRFPESTPDSAKS